MCIRDRIQTSLVSAVEYYFKNLLPTIIWLRLTPDSGVLLKGNSVMGRKSKWDEKFRVNAVELARVSGRPRVQVAKDLEVSDASQQRITRDFKNTSPKRSDLNTRNTVSKAL